MVTTGLTLAILTVVGFSFIFISLPASIKNWMVKHALITRVACFAACYGILGGTLVALFAGAFLDIFVSILLAIQGNPEAKKALDYYLGKFKELKTKLIDSLIKGAAKSMPSPA